MSSNPALHRAIPDSLPIPPSLKDKKHLQVFTLPPTLSSRHAHSYSALPSNNNNSNNINRQQHPSRDLSSRLPPNRSHSSYASSSASGYTAGDKAEAWLGDTVPAAFDTGDPSNPKRSTRGPPSSKLNPSTSNTSSRPYKVS